VIRQLIIEGFKRFESEKLELRPLTILAGRNGAGKTSAIHAVLLARHASQRGDGIAQLNGPFGMALGWFEDIINANFDGPSFSIALVDEADKTVTWTFSQGDTELYAKVAQPNDVPAFFSAAGARGFQYLCAERNGPRIIQKSAPLPLEMLEVGCCGEHVAQIIEKLGSQTVPKLRQLEHGEKEEFALVKAQTERWLSQIARKVDIDTKAFPGTDVISLSFRNDGASSWVRPTNMGFGVSYTLPIVVAAMTAAEGGVLIVENPEAHLHPAGQSEMGVFLARMAAAGLQIVVETHSDHVLNGIRRAIGNDRALPAADAIVHFFSDEFTNAKPLEFTVTGGITEWPAGFFDQYRLDVQRITTARRHT
jgi:predicted ATPase